MNKLQLKSLLVVVFCFLLFLSFFQFYIIKQLLTIEALAMIVNNFILLYIKHIKQTNFYWLKASMWPVLILSYSYASTCLLVNIAGFEQGTSLS